MKNVLYIGNNLQNSSSNTSYMQIFGRLLYKEGYHISYSSSKSNKVLRLLDMLFTCFKKRHHVDIVLIDTYSTQNFYYAFFVSQLCRLLRLKYIPILHGGNLPSRLKSSPKMTRLLFNYAYTNSSPSVYLKEIFENYGYQVNYIPNTIEIKNYKFSQREITTIRLFWLRSFSKIYNPERAIHVLKSLQDKGYAASLCMVGPDSDGTLKDAKSLAQKLGVDVKFTGKLSKQDWIKLSENYNIFINTTNFDNTPVSVIEAMALGLPIVSTNVGGMPYLIKDGIDGILVKPNDVDAMVEGVLKIADNIEFYDKLMHNARKTAEQFDWYTIKHLWFKILN